jgi:hypothetical protein
MIIEKDIPHPEYKTSLHDDVRSTLRKMAPGDSFLFECRNDEYERWKSYCLITGRRMGLKISTKKVENGFRVWCNNYE